MSTNRKYLSIAHNIIESIQTGTLVRGSKLPSLRYLTKLHGISMTTAIAAYRYLEQQGFIYSENKKGFFATFPLVRNSSITFPSFVSEIRAYAKYSDDQIDHTQDNLGTAKIDERLTDLQLIKKSFNSTIKRSSFVLNYQNPLGDRGLRKCLVQHFNLQGLAIDPEKLVITNGCLDAITLALEAVSSPGDTIAVSSPCYSGLLSILKTLNRSLIEIPSTHEGINVKELERLMANKVITACLLTANFQNPTSHSLNNEQKRIIADYAHRFHIPIIEDDVFRELSHVSPPALPIKYYDRDGWIIWCSSISKTLAPGLRLGWCSPGKFTQRYCQLRKIKTLGINQPIQLAVCDYIAKGHYQRYLNRINKTLASHVKFYVSYLANNLPQEAQLYYPNGGLVLWIQIKHLDSRKLVKALKDHNIAIQPGSNFSTTTLYDDSFRINIGLIPDDKMTAQLATLCETIKAMLVK